MVDAREVAEDYPQAALNYISTLVSITSVKRSKGGHHEQSTSHITSQPFKAKFTWATNGRGLHKRPQESLQVANSQCIKKNWRYI